MRVGLILSLVFHGCLLAFALVSLQNVKAFKPPEVVSMPLDIVDISEFSKLKAGLKTAPDQKLDAKDLKKPIAKQEKPKKKTKPKPKRTVEAAPPPVEKEKKVALPPKKDKPKKKAAKPKPKPKKKAKAKPKPKPKKKIVKKKRPKKKKQFEDKIAALLNKVPDSGPSGSQLPDLPGAKKVKGSPRGVDRVTLMNINGAMGRQVGPCWNTLAGGAEAELLVVKVELRLNKDGTLKGAPKVINRGRSPFFQVAVDRAIGALYQCQPYKLPLKDYKHWRHIRYTFDPQEMFR